MLLRYVIPLLLIGGLATVLIQTKKQPPASSNKIPATLVSTQQVQQQRLAQQLDLVGSLVATQSVAIAAEVSGKIDQITVNSNQAVSAGTVLVKLNQQKVQAQLAEADAYLADEQRKLREYRQLLERQAVSQTSFDGQLASVAMAQAKRQLAQSALDDHALRAPFSGVVGLVDISQGALINANQALFNLDNLDRLQLDLKVPDHYLSQLQQGMLIQATTPAWPNQQFIGQLEVIDPRVDANTLNLKVRVSFANPKHQLKPGMMMRATLTLPAATQPIIPVQAIEYAGSKRFVYVIDQQQIAHRTEVQLGARIDNQVFIEQGLTLNDNIVVQGLVNIHDGAKVKIQAPAANATTKPSQPAA